MFGSRITLFRLFGIDVRADFSWLILAILLTWSLAAGYFPYAYPGLSAGTYWSIGVIGAAGLFLSIIVHEMAHSLVARRHGMAMHGITLFLFGGVAEMLDEPAKPRAEFLMAIVGPITSIAIAGLFYGLYLAAISLDLPTAVEAVVNYLAVINFVLAAFNMLPAFPLDGGRVLRAILWGWRDDLRWATRVASTIGGLFGIGLIVLGVFNFIGGNFIGGLWLFLIGLFLYGAAQAAYQQVVVRLGLAGVPVRRLMNEHPVTVPPDLRVSDLIDDYFYRYYYKMFPVVDGDRLLGCVRINYVKELIPEDRARTPVGRIMEPPSEENMVTPDTEASEALKLMNRTGISRLLVAQRGRLAGIITLKDVMRFLHMRMELEEGGEVRRRTPEIGGAVRT